MNDDKLRDEKQEVLSPRGKMVEFMRKRVAHQQSVFDSDYKNMSDENRAIFMEDNEILVAIIKLQKMEDHFNLDGQHVKTKDERPLKRNIPSSF